MKTKITIILSALLLLALFEKSSQIVSSLQPQSLKVEAKSTQPDKVGMDTKTDQPATRQDISPDKKAPVAAPECCDQNQPAPNLPQCDALPYDKPAIYFNLPSANQCKPSHSDSVCRKAPHAEKVKTIVVV